MSYEWQKLNAGNSLVEYVDGFVHWDQEAFIRLVGELEFVKHPDSPRLEYYMNDTNIPYTYGTGDHGRTFHPQPWHPFISLIREQLERELGCVMDVCFVNYYRDSKDHLGWHADDSPEMDNDRPIVTISLGSDRQIWFKEKGSKIIDKITLKSGSCCVMPAGFQRDNLHRIPKAGFQCTGRISLTFRGYKK